MLKKISMNKNWFKDIWLSDWRKRFVIFRTIVAWVTHQINHNRMLPQIQMDSVTCVAKNLNLNCVEQKGILIWTKCRIMKPQSNQFYRSFNVFLFFIWFLNWFWFKFMLFFGFVWKNLDSCEKVPFPFLLKFAHLE